MQSDLNIPHAQVIQLIVGFSVVIQPSQKRRRRPSSSDARSQRGRGSGRQVQVCSQADLSGARAPCPPPRTWSQQVPGEASGVSRMQENLIAAGVPPQTPLGEFTALPTSLAGGRGGWLPPPEKFHPALDPLDLGLRPIRPSPLDRNMGGLAASRYDGLARPIRREGRVCAGGGAEWWVDG